MNYCIFQYNIGGNQRIYGPYDQAKCRALLASHSIRLRTSWTSNDLQRELTQKLERDALLISLNGKLVRSYVVMKMEAPKNLE